jgi:hypothetical protein
MGVEEPKNRAPVKALVDLDDPAELDDVEIGDRAPDTARPDFDTGAFAQHVESAEERMTQPPSPTYDMLRDSCKTAIVDEILDEEQILRPSSRKQKITDRR